MSLVQSPIDDYLVASFPLPPPTAARATASLPPHPPLAAFSTPRTRARMHASQ